MLRRHVERFEVVVVVLELGPFDDEEPEAREDRLDALAQQRQRVAVADARRAARQRDVDGAAGGRDCGGGLERSRRARFDVGLELVGELRRAAGARRAAPRRATFSRPRRSPPLRAR